MMTTDNLQRSTRNGFGTSALDRASHRRHDASWLERKLQESTSIFVPVWRSKNLVHGESAILPALLKPSQLNGFLDDAQNVIYLGRQKDSDYFALHMSPSDHVNAHAREWGSFRDLRSVSALLSHEDGSLLAYAKAICHWHERHRFCGDCGHPTESSQAGHVRICTNKACGQSHFPRTDPVIIVVVHSDDACLLGRQSVWPEHMYSALAGFVEPGETLENAVMREVQEETGVQVQHISYHSSQPWPFPASLMLGFMAGAQRGQVTLKDHELEDARWFTRQEMAALMEEGKLRLPPAFSIAYHLIEDWYNTGSREPLKAIHATIGTRAS